jgi:cytochrome c553
MHNSQNNSAMNFDLSTTPNPILLRGTCLGCHAQARNTRIVDGYVPQVRHTDGTGDLAGGNFGYMFGSPARDATDSGATASSVAHNVWDFGVIEATLTVPPGDKNSTGIVAGGSGGQNLTCAGQWGCHGMRGTSGSMLGISGSHHNNAIGSISVAMATNAEPNAGRSYRFLKGVAGYEDSTWQDVTSTTEHNVYYGVVFGSSVEGNATTPGAATISGLCAECHGLYHGPGTPEWLRHPTDAILPSTAGSEYNSYEGANGSLTYDTRAPVGKPANPPVSPVAAVVPGTDVVVCLSCHSAHATANADILKWNYEDIVTGRGTSDLTRCFVCHTQKDAVNN